MRCLACSTISAGETKEAIWDNMEMRNLGKEGEVNTVSLKDGNKE